MSSQSYDTQQQEVWQELDTSDEDWNELRTCRLPADLESKAIELKAWSRQREVRSIGDLLRALLVLAALGYSFQRLAMWATLKGIAHMSERAWRKRMQQSAVWIAWLLCELLSVQSTPSWLETGKQRANRILLIDATRLRIPGGTGDDVRLREKRGKNFNQELVWWAGWILLVTTLKLQSWSDEEVAQLYRARWQVELVFKRLKQGLNWHGVSIKDWDHLSTLVQLKLIVWCLQEQEQLWMREQLCQLIQVPQRDWDETNREQDEATDQWVISSWLLTQQGLQDLCMLLRGRWSRHHLQQCLPRLGRYLLSRKRKKRIHQETSSRSWLIQKMARLMPFSAA